MDFPPAGGGGFEDEESLLDFRIWAAELELVVGSARGKAKPDAPQCLPLLQKLGATLERASRAEVKECQRRCEDALVDILLKGAPPPVRRLICQVMGRLYTLGDQLPLYSRVSSLQLFLGTREALHAEQSTEEVRLGALELMAALYYTQGRYLGIGVQETVSTAAKYCSARGLEDSARQAALALLAAAVEGVGGGHRGAAGVQSEALRVVERLLGGRETGAAVRLGCANVLRTLAACGGAHLWVGGLAGYEAARTLCLAGLEDPSPAVRGAFAEALGALAGAATSEAAAASVKGLEKRPKAAAAQDRALKEVPEQCLATPFVEAAVAGSRGTCGALAAAWVGYMGAARRGGMEEGPFLAAGMRVLEALGAACAAAGNYPERAPAPGEGELGMGVGAGERPHAQACTLYVLRAGLIEQLGEAAQRQLLSALGSLLASPLGAHTPVAIVALEGMALLLELLGEVTPETRAALEPAVGLKLAGPHAALRRQAAAAVAALAVAEPSSAARLVGASLANLHLSLTRLREAAAGVPERSRPPVPGTPRGPGTAKLRPHMSAAHGWALAAAALLAAAPRLPLGVPSSLPASALEYAAHLTAGVHHDVQDPQQQQQQLAPALCVEREAGYILLGALCFALPAELLAERHLSILELFSPALGPNASSQLDTRLRSTASQHEHLAAMELWWRTAALEALLAYAQGVLPLAPRASQQQLAECVAGLLRPTLGVVAAHAALADPARSARGGPGGVLAGAAALLQLRLLEVYLALPSPAAYAGELRQLSQLCLQAVAAAGGGGQDAAVLAALRQWLNPADAMLGPWQAERDPLEQALHCYSGLAGGPGARPWEAGGRQGVGYATPPEVEAAGGATATAPGGAPATPPLPPPAGFAPYPQPRSLGAALLEAHLGVLGRAVEGGEPAMQAAILEALLTLAQGGPQKRKDKDPQRRQVAAAAAAAAALAGLSRASARTAAALAPSAKALAEEVLEESASSPALQRAAADLLAAAASLSPDAAALQLVKALCHDMAATASLSRRATLALAVGSIGRAVGGLSLQAVLPLAVQTLLAVARASDASIAVWVLHALLSLANAAGLSFVPHVPEALALAQSMLLSSEVYTLPGLLPAVGRLANAMVAVLGPDYTLGSAPYHTCKAIIADMRGAQEGHPGSLPSAEESVGAALEAVLYAQMLVLFAPQAVPARAHLPLLGANLLSRQPRLRRAAADTLRHLAERDAPSVLAERVEPALFAALDGETDPAIAAQIKATLRTLLAAGAPLEPSRWVALLTEVVMAAAPGSASVAEEVPGGALNGEGGSDGEEDEDVGGSGRRPSSAAPAAAAGPPPAAGAAAAGGAPALTPRLRTRLFAAGLLLALPGRACTADTRHADLGAAQRAAGQGDWLALRLQQLVDLGYRMATGQLEALRPLGLRLLGEVVACFGEAPDPVLEGQKLLELYQAQIVSALRASLAPGASPVLRGAGATLAAAFLERGLAGGDAVVMERLMALLAAPLVQWGAGSSEAAAPPLPQQQAEGAEGAPPAAAAEALYAEWVGVQAQVALLEAHAHCASLAAGPQADDGTRAAIARAQSQHLPLLLGAWVGLLQDYVVLSSQPRAVQQLYRPHLLRGVAEATAAPAGVAAGAAGGSVAALATVKQYAQRAWPAALDAATCVLAVQAPARRTAAAQQQHAALLDVCQLVLRQAAGGSNGSGGGAAREAAGAQLLTVLTALQQLTGEGFAAAGWVAPSLTQELAPALLQLLQPAVLPPAGDGSRGQQQARAAAEATAEVLRQLPPAVAARAAVGAAAKACIDAAGGSGPALQGAVAAVARQLQAAGSAEAFALGLHDALQLALQLLAAAGQYPEEGAAAAGLVQGAVAAAQTHSETPASAALPAPRHILASAAVSAAQQAQQALSAGQAARLGAALGCLLPLAGGLGEGAQPSVHSAATAELAASALSEDDWEEDPFGAEGGQTPAAAEAAPAAVDTDAAAAAAPVAVDAADLGAAEAAGAHEELAQEGSTANGVAAAAAAGGGEPTSQASAVCQLCTDVLRSALASGDAGVQQQALHAVRSYLQQQSKAAAQQQEEDEEGALEQAQQRLRFGLECAATVLPGAAAHAHELALRDGVLAEPQVQAVGEALRLGVVAVHAAAPGPRQAALLQLVVPLLIESAAPGGVPTPALADTGVKLLTLLASGPAAAGFKASVAQLPPATKQRLQAALQAAATSSAAAVAAAPAAGAGRGAPAQFGLHTPAAAAAGPQPPRPGAVHFNLGAFQKH